MRHPLLVFPLGRAPGVLLALGTLLVPAARADTLSGTVLGPGGPAEGINIDVFHAATGRKLPRADDTSDADGAWSVTLPAGTYDVGFDTTAAPGDTLAPQLVEDVEVAGDSVLPDTVLEPGFLLFGRVLGPTGAPLRSVDLDLEEASTGADVFVTGDTTDALGVFEFPVPAGSFLVEIEQQVRRRLRALEHPVTVSTDTDLGDLQLESGVVLKGRVWSPTRGPIAMADLDVEISATQESVALGHDHAGPTGAYLLLVPTGLVDVFATPPGDTVLFESEVRDVDVQRTTVLDVPVYPEGFDINGPTPVEVGDLFLGRFDSGLEIDEVRFQAVEGLLASFRSVARMSTTRPDYALIAPSGEKVDITRRSRNGRTGASTSRVRLPETGEYLVQLFPLNGTPGAYSFRATWSVPGALRIRRAAGSILVAGATETIGFVGLEGGTLQLTVVPSGGLIPRLELFTAPGGAVVPLVSLPSRPGVLAAGADLPESGAYALQIGGLPGSTGSFRATLRIGFPPIEGSEVPE